ncbi:heme ABC exporter ATP-binding protein CcmA [Oceaniglobus roseus]|uniref:heme ABC exporter ATP-binding protein CcmA n=1 Tax=Oceaniglobus roseus TaxID=1737570 RepID=UPI000C7F4024|nr:heme ABC exporter ATP-binding protein CcmA [Kandeliimicrobium roseum]
MALFEVEDLSCARGGVPVLEGVGFALAPGQVLVLRGPNGAGKTTLLRTLAGLQPPLTGRILPGPEVLAYGGHADGVKGALSVEENLTFWAGVFGTGSIAGALEAFDLKRLRGRAAQNLSAGQKRRLGLARMLLTGRPVWALDEPTVSLDAASVALFASALGRHLEGGGAALIATHIDLGFPAEVLDVSRFRAVAAPVDGLDGAFA